MADFMAQAMSDAGVTNPPSNDFMSQAIADAAPVQSATPSVPAQPAAVQTGRAVNSNPLIGTDAQNAMNYSGANAVGGLLRGAGNVGATIMRALPNFLGGDTAQESAARRANLDPSIAQFTGADSNSTAYKTGKLGAEIAGTAGIGGLLAKPLQMMASTPAIEAAIQALQTGGLKAGDLGWSLPGALTRAAAGATTGATTAGMIDPSSAQTGAIIGGVMPLVAKGILGIGDSIGSLIHGPQQTPEALAAIQAAHDAGYLIPPTQAKPTLFNRAIEGFSGKLTTAQNASARNATVTDSLAASALGLPDGTKITPELLQGVRNTAGSSYNAVASTGTVTPGPSYRQALDDIAAPYVKAMQGFPDSTPSPIIKLVDSVMSPAFDSGSAIAKISQLRNDANIAYTSGDKTLGGATKQIANTLEDAIDQHLQDIGAPSQMLNDYRNARTLIAKTYTVENALNNTTGTVDARKLGVMANKGKPLTGDLLTAANFANRFPKAAQTVERMGSLPQTSPLDWGMAATLGLVTSHPAALGAALLRPAARALTLSSAVQNGLANQATPGVFESILQNPEAQQLLYRTAPIIATSGQ